MQIINFYQKKKFSKHVQCTYLEASTIYKKIPLFELDFFVVQKYPH